MEQFQDRADAGRVLAGRLTAYAGRNDVLVLALPRGGVPVGFEVAKRLSAPLDVFLVRKLGVPGHEELAMGAVATGDVEVLNADVIDPLGIPSDLIEVVARRERKELRRQEELFRRGRPPPAIAGRVVILVDDGLATGSTMRAAVEAVRKQNPEQIVVAVPVGSSETCAQFGHEVDEAICAVAAKH